MNFYLSTLAGLALIRASVASSCASIENVELTFYGWHDNDPPSPDNAFDCGRGHGPDGNPIAGGSGSYSDPISFATAIDNPNFAKCALVYIPSLRKYFRNEDDCAECKTDWYASHKYHIDLWTGSNKVDGGGALVSCENSLSGGSNIIINNAPDGLPVDLTPLYDGNTCHQTTYLVENAAGLCVGSKSTPESSTVTGVGSTTRASVPDVKVSTTLLTTTSTPHFKPSKSEGTHESTDNTCEWAGHCKEAKCKTENDCSDILICGPHQTCVSP